MIFPKVILTSLAVGALSVNALTIPVAREPAPEPDFQDVDARFLPLVASGVAGLIGGALFKPNKAKANGNPRREVEAQDFEARAEFATQDLEARILPIIGSALAGLAGTAVGSYFTKSKSPREISDDLFSREPEEWARWAESVRSQASKREPSPEPVIPTIGWRAPSTPTWWPNQKT